MLQGISRAHGRAQRQARPLTAGILAAVKATASTSRPFEGNGKGRESAERASWRARVDVALVSVLRDWLVRRSDAAALTWGDLEFREYCPTVLQVIRSKTDPGTGTWCSTLTKMLRPPCGPSSQWRSCCNVKPRSSAFPAAGRSSSKCVSPDYCPG